MKLRRLVLLFPLAATLISCGSTTKSDDDGLTPTAVRWLKPSETAPSGSAPGAKYTLLSTHSDGVKEYALVLREGDEVLSAVLKFANDEHVAAAHFTAIGAVRDPEVAWVDPARHEYKAMRFAGQTVEVLSLIGDIGVGAANGSPVVHAHTTLGRANAQTFGGHLVSAVVAPNLEVFITTYPTPLKKKIEPQTGLQFFDLSPQP